MAAENWQAATEVHEVVDGSITGPIFFAASFIAAALIRAI
jgi:hypothetical protein